ncbi:MAG: hypothetical protein HYW33_03735 [Candidatus Blackburnbacteria bacterium]|nr:hypothetical protein [Candidatus Blackburnbacteria bacterium]
MLNLTHMYRLHLYLTDSLKKELEAKAKLSKKTKAEVARLALEKGLKQVKIPKSNSAQALLALARFAESLPYDKNAPKDVVKNMDYYTWGGEKDKDYE